MSQAVTQSAANASSAEKAASITTSAPALSKVQKGKQRVIELLSTDESDDEITLGRYERQPVQKLPGRPPVAESARPRMTHGVVQPLNVAQHASQIQRTKRPREPSAELEVPAKTSPAKKRARPAMETGAFATNFGYAATVSAPKAKAAGRGKALTLPPNSLALLPEAPTLNARPASPYWHLAWAAIQGLAAAGDIHEEAKKLQDNNHLVGGVTMIQILKEICFRYSYYLTAWADGSLERSMSTALQLRKCFRYLKTSTGNIWYIDESVDMATTGGGKGQKQAGEADTSTASVAGTSKGPTKRIQMATAAPIKVPLDEIRPAALPEAAEQIFATSLAHLPEIPPGQAVPYPLVTLARAAILSSPFRRLKIDEIASAILAKYPQVVPQEAKLKNPEGWQRAWARGPLTRNLGLHLCFFYGSAGRGANHWLVDLQVDPRTKIFRAYKKAEVNAAFGGSVLADVDKTSLDKLQRYLTNMEALYKDKEERYKRREDILGAMAPQYASLPVPVGQQSLAPKPAVVSPQPRIQLPSFSSIKRKGQQADGIAHAGVVAGSSSAPMVSDGSHVSKAAGTTLYPPRESARSGSIELDEVLPSPKKKPRPVPTGPPEVAGHEGGLSANGSGRAKTASLTGSVSVSDPGSLEFSDPSRPVQRSRSPAGPPTPLVDDDSSSHSITPEPMPIPQFVCAFVDKRKPEPCQSVFFTTKERDCHLRYMHAQRSDTHDWRAKMAAKAQAKLDADMERIAEEAKLKKQETRKKAKSIKIRGAATASQERFQTFGRTEAGPSQWI